ncbi:MAG: 2'-5' RNA ligase family protein [Pseudonocardia sp.]|nr:2'-5' RNA ligase family protein [Pseudonocardia sp.]
MQPLVVTALLDDAAQACFDDLRRRHFPPERNHLAAHLTLFHALPGEHEEVVAADLREAAGRAPVPVRVRGPRLLGRGVAIDLDAPDLLALRAVLARRWAPWLTRQDAGKRDLHVTVQNKVEPEAARALHADLTSAALPRSGTAVGLALWRYLGGPWAEVARWPFAG